MTLNGSPAFLIFNNVDSSNFARTLLLVLLSSISLFSFSQGAPIVTGDTIAPKKGKSPMKALVFSAVVPGLGQAYNKKYWKIPIIYAATGTTIYLFSSNNKTFRQYQTAYRYRTDADSLGTEDEFPDLSDDQILEYENHYRRNRDLSAIFTLLFYTVNIVDAYVDAHLSTFDVSDDLTLHVSPALNFYSSRKKPAIGLTLSLQF
jgi:hypothetical protein